MMVKKLLYFVSALLICLPSAVGAQAVGFTLIADRNLGSDMPLLFGWAATARIGKEPIVFRYERQEGRATRQRVVCAGLRPLPEAGGPVCPLEPARLSLESAAGSLGYRFAFGAGDRLRYTAEPALGLMRVKGGYTGRLTNNAMRKQASLLRGTIDFAASAQLLRALPVHAMFGARVSAALGAENWCSDCFTPSWGNGYVGVGVSASLVVGVH